MVRRANVPTVSVPCACHSSYFLSFIFLDPERTGDAPTMLVTTADKSPGFWGRPEEARSAIFRSEDCAQSWQRAADGLPEELPHMVNMLVNHPSDRNAAFAGLGSLRRGVKSQGTLIATRDRGASWLRLPLEVPPVLGLWAAPE